MEGDFVENIYKIIFEELKEAQLIDLITCNLSHAECPLPWGVCRVETCPIIKNIKEAVNHEISR